VKCGLSFHAASVSIRSGVSESLRARRALAKWLSLHPTNVTQKVDFILQHFVKNAAHLLNGAAKAMVVTDGRAAVKYKLAFDKAIKENKLQDIRALVAFSGKVKSKDLGRRRWLQH
jgi:type I restriction enzyme R subunit